MSETAGAATARERDADKEGIVATAATGPGSGRLASLDVFRGITVAGMILANNVGDSSYAPFRHAEWDGWTPTDLIFPSCLFIVGVSLTFALTKRREANADLGPVVAKIVRRSLIIFALGIALAAFPDYLKAATWEKIRIPGVLQRIALCYGAAALIFLATRVRGQVAATLALLAGYAALMRYAPVPDFGAGDWNMGRDLGAYLDKLLLRDHIYRVGVYDPEGLLSTLPAVATTLLGVLAGHWLRSGRERSATCSGLFVAGTLGVIAGASWGAWFPINKALWTSSFVLLAGGWSAIGLACCYWLIDVQGRRGWAGPFRVLGTNPIVAYGLASLGSRLLNMPYLPGDGARPISVHDFLSRHYLTPYLAPMDATLAYAALILVACILVVGVMDLLHLHVRA